MLEAVSVSEGNAIEPLEVFSWHDLQALVKGKVTFVVFLIHTEDAKREALAVASM